MISWSATADLLLLQFWTTEAKIVKEPSLAKLTLLIASMHMSLFLQLWTTEAKIVKEKAYVRPFGAFTSQIDSLDSFNAYVSTFAAYRLEESDSSSAR